MNKIKIEPREEIKEEIKEEVKEVKEEVKEEIKEVKEEVKEEIKEVKEDPAIAAKALAEAQRLELGIRNTHLPKSMRKGKTVEEIQEIRKALFFAWENANDYNRITK